MALDGQFTVTGAEPRLETSNHRREEPAACRLTSVPARRVLKA